MCTPGDGSQDGAAPAAYADVASASSVYASGKLRRVPNQPKTPNRVFRIPDELYRAAQDVAAERGESLSEVVRAALERYVKRNRKP